MMSVDEMTLFERKAECCGCSACMSVCPKSAITMREDTEGFLYPSVDNEKCVGCKQCINVCPLRHRRQIIAEEKAAPHIGILNLQNSMNYGASIAAVVLQDVVQSIVGDAVRVRTIEYSPKYQGPKASYIFYFVKMNNGWINCIRGAFRRVFKEDKGAMSKARITRKHRFQRFHAKFLRLSDTYEATKDFDDGTNWKAFIVGSDIVWHPKRITTFQREVFFLRFAEGIKRISYAASTDSSNDVLEENKDLYREGLKSIDRISVREKTNIDYLQKLTEKPIRTCCDPAFLYTPEQYDYMLEESAFKPVRGEQYIYVYLLDRNDYMADYAKRLAKEKGMKLCFFATKYPDLEEYGENCMADGPAEFLARLRYATYVLTNSFHCSVFSLMFHKKFLSFERGKTSIKSSDLLSAFGLLDRIVTSGREKDIDDPIDFDEADAVIREMRASSLQYLEEALAE